MERAESILNDEVNSDSEPGDILKKIEFQKVIISSVKSKPWPMKKKIMVLKKARDFVEKYEGRLRKHKSYRAIGIETWKKASRLLNELTAALTPWNKRIRAVESYFGSSVASYFTFLRWLVYINLVIGIMTLAFVVLPEVVNGTSADYKRLPHSEVHKAWDLETLWALGGYLEHSVLFYGYYSSEVVGNGYRLPLAYFLVGVMGFAYSFVALLRKMARNSRYDGQNDSSDDYTFSWKLFCSWDYMIGNAEAAENKSAAIATAFRESIVEEQEKEKKMEVRKKLRLFLRIIANILVMLLLAGSLYGIQYSVSRAQSQINDGREKTFWEQNEVGVVVTLVTLIAPSLFEVIGTMENYHPRNTLRIQLGRILMLYLGNLYSLMIGLLNYVTAATEQSQLNAAAVPENIVDPSDDLIVVEPGLKRRIFRNISDYVIVSISREVEPNMNVEVATTLRQPDELTHNMQMKGSTECWETYVGQELLKLSIIDLISTILTVLLIDFIRALVVRYLNACCCWDLEKQFPEYGEFKIAENVLHLIYNQGVTWIGSFFCPLLPIINAAKLTVLMYLRSWAVVTCNVPYSRVFRASGSNFYLAMLLFMLFLSLLPTMWVIIQCPPSNCGPFRNKERIHAVLTETMEDIPNWMKMTLHHMSTPVVIIPAMLLLFMIVYYLQAVSRSTKQRNTELRLQLQYERKEGRKNIFKMGAGVKEREAAKKKVLSSVTATVTNQTEITTNNKNDEAIKVLVSGSNSKNDSGKKMSPSRRSSTATDSTAAPLPSTSKVQQNTHVSGITYDSLQRQQFAKNRQKMQRCNTDSPSSCASPRKDCYFSPMSSIDPSLPGPDCQHLHYQGCGLHQHNMMLNQQPVGIYQTIPRYGCTNTAGTTMPHTLLWQPTQVSNVPCIIMPTLQSQDTESGKQEQMAYARFDPIRRNAGNTNRDDCSWRPNERKQSNSTFRCSPHRAGPRNSPRASSGQTRQSNVRHRSNSLPRQKTVSSSDMNDVFTSDGEPGSHEVYCDVDNEN